MQGLLDFLIPDGKFLGIEWNTWKIVGWAGNLVFFSRFIIQWFATEKKGQVVIPVIFWWFSLAGTLLLLTYAVFYRKDSVFIFAYAFAWIPYIRNLIIHYRHLKAHSNCVKCGSSCAPDWAYCAACGTAVPLVQEEDGRPS